MKSFYSIVYSRINSVSQERLNLGLLMLGENGQLKFRLSNEKVNLSKKMINAESASLLKSYLQGIENKVSEKEELIRSSMEMKPEYLSYLSNYSNNLIAFTAPKVINVDVEESFEKLFEKFVYKIEMEALELKKQSKLEKVESEMKKKSSQRVNTDIKLTSDKLDFIIYPIEVDMIGKNDRPVLNQFIDFDKSTNAVKSHINDYTSLIKPFELTSKHEGKFFIVGDEPKKDNKSQHLMWEHLRTSPLISEGIVELVQTDESERVFEYLEEHDVQPYFDLR